MRKYLVESGRIACVVSVTSAARQGTPPTCFGN